jgi:hypothetical protein
MTTTTTATPTKLRSGAWGAKVAGTVRAGETVTITTRGGKSWQARVSKVVWTGDGVSIVATESLDRPAATEPQRGRCSRCGEHCSPRYRTCYECSRGGASFRDSRGNFVLGTDD